MNEFNTILTKLKEIIAKQVHPDRKVLDKDVASTLNIKPLRINDEINLHTKPYWFTATKID